MQLKDRLGLAFKGDAEALDFLTRWITKRNWRAMNRDLTPNEVQLLKQQCEKEITQNKNPNAIYLRAVMYLKGIGYPKNLNFAKEQLKIAVELEQVCAMVELAKLLADEGNDPLIVELLEKAMKAENAEAYYTRSAAFYNPVKNIRIDPKKGIELLDKAISLGSISAKYVRASYYYFEQKTPDYEEGIKLLDEAIEGNHISAMRLRGIMHLNLLGQPADPLTGIKLIRRAHMLDKKIVDPAREKILLDCVKSINLELIYHAAHILFDQGEKTYLIEYIESGPTQFLKFMVEDAFLSESEKAKYADILRESFPIVDYTNVFNLDYFKMMAKCYLDAAKIEEQAQNFDNALSLYKKVIGLRIPVESEVIFPSTSIACLAISKIVYSQAKDEGNAEHVSFDLVKNYLELGIKHGNKECEKLYDEGILPIIKANSSEVLAENSWEQKAELHQKYCPSLHNDKGLLDTFIAKHHLKNPKYWQEHPGKADLVELTFHDKDYKVPADIGEIMKLTKDRTKSSTEKVKAISLYSKNRHNFFTLIIANIVGKDSKEAVKCYQDAEQMEQYLQK